VPPAARPPDLPAPVRLTRADAGEVLTLQRAAYVTEAQLHDDLRLPPLVQTLDEVRAELADPAVTALGVRDGGRLVAAVRLREVGAGRLALGRLTVAPDRQGRGLGTVLLRAAESAVPGTTVIDLFTGELSAANLRLYRREGYVETHRTPAGNQAVVHLTKTLR
jgi:GNAT superfamily N-acetyltransferase